MSNSLHVNTICGVEAGYVVRPQFEAVQVPIVYVVCRESIILPFSIQPKFEWHMMRRFLSIK